MASVAVVGAGIAGLACARTLQNAGHGVRVFEKSRGVGGRMATRRTANGTFDHGAQYFTARDPLFRRVVEDWVAAGVVAPYAGRIANLVQGRAEAVSSSEPRYIATPAMTAACRSMATGIDVSTECRVTAATPGEEGWRLSWDEGGDTGFDAVVLAIPPDQATLLCTAVPALAAEVATGSHDPCWAVLVRYGAPPGVDFDAAFVEDAVLGWVMRDASRPGRAPGERWVLHASAAWSREHLEQDAAAIAPQVVAAFHAAAGIDARPVEALAHRWRYALSRGLGAGCLWDGAHRIGACGDWCADGRIEGAYLSGVQLAQRVIGTA